MTSNCNDLNSIDLVHSTPNAFNDLHALNDLNASKVSMHLRFKCFLIVPSNLPILSVILIIPYEINFHVSVCDTHMSYSLRSLDGRFSTADLFPLSLTSSLPHILGPSRDTCSMVVDDIFYRIQYFLHGTRNAF